MDQFAIEINTTILLADLIELIYLMRVSENDGLVAHSGELQQQLDEQIKVEINE